MVDQEISYQEINIVTCGPAPTRHYSCTEEDLSAACMLQQQKSVTP